MTKKQKIRLGIVSGACAVALGVLIAGFLVTGITYGFTSIF